MSQDETTGRRRGSARTPIEDALRYIGSRRGGDLTGHLRSAIEWPDGDTGVALRPLTQPTDILVGWSDVDRATALQKLIIESVEHASVGSTEQARERRALRAGLRLLDPGIKEPWASALKDRCLQLKVLTGIFPADGTVQPMEAAWSRGVRLLAARVDHILSLMHTSSDWEKFRDQIVEYPSDPEDGRKFRPASEGAQPFTVDRFVTTVYMEGRVAVRRITERVVTAMADDVKYYTARTFSGRHTFGRDYVPVRALWGCQAEQMPSSRPSEPMVTRLHFPRPLQRGEKVYFASEAFFDHEPSAADDRDWVDVDIDHHGTIAGALYYDQAFPISGLTVRVRFDSSYIPPVSWWYAETTESERSVPPALESGRLLQVVAGELSHTFVGMICNPRESYGLGWQWE